MDHPTPSPHWEALSGREDLGGHDLSFFVLCRAGPELRCGLSRAETLRPLQLPALLSVLPLGSLSETQEEEADPSVRYTLSMEADRKSGSDGSGAPSPGSSHPGRPSQQSSAPNEALESDTSGFIFWLFVLLAETGGALSSEPHPPHLEIAVPATGRS